MPHRKVDNLVGGAPSVSEVSLADAYTVFQYDVGGVVLYQGFVSIKWRHPSINLVELQSESGVIVSFYSNRHKLQLTSFVLSLKALSSKCGWLVMGLKVESRTAELSCMEAVNAASAGVSARLMPGLATNSIYFCFLFEKNLSFAWRAN